MAPQALSKGELSGRWAVVTGGASGLGLAMAHRFASEGMRIAIADVSSSALRSAVDALRPVAPDVLGSVVDVTDAAALEAFAAEVADGEGVGLLCANAGIVRPGTVLHEDRRDWELTVRVNVFGVLDTIRAFVPRMILAAEPSHVVITASIAGLLPTPGLSSYHASKHAVVGVADCLAAELEQAGHDHVRVSILCPGGIATDIWRAVPEESIARARSEDRVAADTFAAAADSTRSDQFSAKDVADIVWREVLARSPWIVPAQSRLMDGVRARHEAVMAGLRLPDGQAGPG